MKEKEMKRVPKLRFPEFTDDWEQRKLEDYLTVSAEKNTGNIYGRSDVLSVSGDYGIVNQIEFQGRSFAGASVSNYGVVQTGDVVYTKSPLNSNPYGIIKTNKGKPGIVSTLYAVYHPKENAFSDFIQVYFEQHARMNNYMHPLVNKGAKNDMKVSAENALKGPVYFPSRIEQESISAFFSVLDHLITLHQRKLEKLKKLKKGLVQKLFSQEVRFKADDGSEFPEWEEKKLGEFGTFIKGAALSKADISEYGSPFILYGELYTTYKEVAYNIQRRTQAIVDKKYYSCIGDVVIPTSGESAEEISTATCVMVPNVILGGDLNIFRSDIVDGRIMSYILNHQVKWKIAMIAQGKSIVHIQAKQLSNIYVKYPVSKVEQQKIADCLSLLDDVIEKQKVTLAAWEELKKGLLQQMFV